MLVDESEEERPAFGDAPVPRLVFFILLSPAYEDALSHLRVLQAALSPLAAVNKI